MRVPPLINTLELVRAKAIMLEELGYMEIASKVRRFAMTTHIS